MPFMTQTSLSSVPVPFFVKEVAAVMSHRHQLAALVMMLSSSQLGSNMQFQTDHLVGQSWRP